MRNNSQGQNPYSLHTKQNARSSIWSSHATRISNGIRVITVNAGNENSFVLNSSFVIKSGATATADYHNNMNIVN
jgi:hypothetical protein